MAFVFFGYLCNAKAIGCSMKILVTGASGFIGSFLVEAGLDAGHEVWAAMRDGSSRRYLKDKRINFIDTDLSAPERLKEQLARFKAGHGAWDFIIHAAGVTKCTDKNEFYRTNYEGTRNLIDTLDALSMLPKKFIYLSSLSVFGPVREEQPYKAIEDDDEPKPNTLYGKSKLLAERYIIEHCKCPYIILRPTGVYGPRERDYYQMAASIKRHIGFAAGYKPQLITFIYVKDLVKAVYLAIEKPVADRCYFVSEPQGYDSRVFSDYIQKEMGVKRVLHIKAPLWMLKAVSCCAGSIARLTGKPATLNSDKYKIMKQRNWLCDTTPIEAELGFSIDYPLEKGTRETIKWYKQEKWL